MRDLPFDDIYSHSPSEGGDRLSEHLPRVASLARANASVGDARVPDGTPAGRVASICGYCHDISKATTWFQRHLDDQSVPQRLSHHAPLGALASYWCMRTCGTSQEDALVAFVAVSKHHGTLPDVAEYIRHQFVKNDERINQLDKQVDDIDAHPAACAVVNDALAAATDDALSWEQFREDIRSGDIYDDLDDYITQGSALNRDACSPGFYGAVFVVWSALVQADKIDAATLPTDVEPIRPSVGSVKNYIDTFDEPAPSSLEATLNAERESARESIVTAVSRLDTNGGVGTITLPTGLGKTLSSFDAATRLLARPDRDDGRIIYVLPYTSIVDQTAEEIQHVFNAAGIRENGGPIDPYGWALTIDHHLESTATRISAERSNPRGGPGADDEEGTDEFADEELLLGKLWGSGVIVTTYVQLFESLVCPSNAQSLKLPNLHDSVIILDEPQTLPLDWWRVARRAVEMATDMLDATVLSMSATQPHLFAEDDAFDDYIEFDAPELVDDPGPSHYFEAFHRTDYSIHESIQRFRDVGMEADTLNHASAAHEVVDAVCSTDSSALAICNTVSSARSLSLAVEDILDARGRTALKIGDVFDDLLADAESLDEITADALAETVRRERTDGRVVTLHLTARHRPNDRRIILNAAEELATDDHPFVFVATQLVEAGVDVSFRRVYRDIAPMPSLVQAAGRCNRSFEWPDELGDVTVWRLGATEGQTKEPSRLVYARENDYNLLDVTRTALNAVELDDRGRVPDTDIAAAGVGTYYETLVRRRPGNPEFAWYLNEGKFETVREEAEYIDERDTVEVVVCRVSDDDDLVDEYLEATANEEYEQIRRVRARLSERAVSVPRHDFDASAVEEVLSVTPSDDPALVSVRSEDVWFSSEFGAAATDFPSTPQG